MTSRRSQADSLVNFYFADDDTKTICELQLPHANMMSIREQFGAHNGYDQLRKAVELLMLTGHGDVVTKIEAEANAKAAAKQAKSVGVAAAAAGSGGGGGGGGGASSAVVQQCLQAVQALQAEMSAVNAEMSAVKAENRELAAKVTTLSAKVEELEQGTSATRTSTTGSLQDTAAAGFDTAAPASVTDLEGRVGVMFDGVVSRVERLEVLTMGEGVDL